MDRQIPTDAGDCDATMLLSSGPLKALVKTGLRPVEEAEVVRTPLSLSRILVYTFEAGVRFDKQSGYRIDLTQACCLQQEQAQTALGFLF